MHGLMRVRSFTQDDAHIFCADEKQVESEIESLIKPSTKVLYAETPTNPGVDIIDLELLGKIAKKYNVTTRDVFSNASRVPCQD